MEANRLELDKPVTIAGAGPAVAGGMELVLCCDFRVMEQSTFFGVYCRHWGIPFGDKVAITFSIEENVLLI